MTTEHLRAADRAVSRHDDLRTEALELRERGQAAANRSEQHERGAAVEYHIGSDQHFPLG